MILKYSLGLDISSKDIKACIVVIDDQQQVKVKSSRTVSNSKSGLNDWAIYSGDVNQDNAIDAFVYILMDADIINGQSGYFATDSTGDGFVDAYDYLILDPNLLLGVGSIKP